MGVLIGLHAAGAAHHVGADIRRAGDAQRQEFSRRVERQRRLGLMVAGLVVGQEDLAAAGDPFHRPTDPLCRPQDQRVLGVGEVLGAEAAADIRGDEAHAAREHAQGACRQVAVGVDVLAGDVQRVAIAGRVVAADAAARLHRVGDDAVVVEPPRDRVRGGGEGGLGRGGVAGMPVHAQIAGHQRRQQRRAGRGCGGGGDDGLQRIIFDRNALGGIERLGVRLGDDQHHRLADMAHRALRQQGLRREGEGFPRLRVGLRDGQHRPQPIGVRVLAGENGKHAGGGSGRGDVEAGDPRVGMRRAQQGGVRQAVEHQVVEVGPATDEEPRILASFRCVTDGGSRRQRRGSHAFPPSSAARILGGPGLAGGSPRPAPPARCRDRWPAQVPGQVPTAFTYRCPRRSARSGDATWALAASQASKASSVLKFFALMALTVGRPVGRKSAAPSATAGRAARICRRPQQHIPPPSDGGRRCAFPPYGAVQQSTPYEPNSC